ncbi:nitrilase [Pseudonocardia sp. CNS-139]|nr:nitrilase [Pseudonocardia sp. CNS-139]
MAVEYPSFKAAAVQSEPAYLDIDATLDKACDFIAEAARNGARLVAFPEAYLPGYPIFAFMGDTNYVQRHYHELYKNSVEVPSEAIRRLSLAARQNDVHLCMSCDEKDGGSLYLTQFWFSPTGDLMGKHRKLRPSGAERLIWGEGSGALMPVFQTEIGNLGGLQCWEHYVPLDLGAMNGQNEQVHVASWPGSDLFPHDVEIGSRYYAMSTQTYVLMTSNVYGPVTAAKVCETPEQEKFYHELSRCQTAIYGPDGVAISEVIPVGEEGIAYGDIDLSKIIDQKYYMDPAGHYSNRDLTMTLDRRRQPTVGIIGNEQDNSISFDVLNPLVNVEA